MDNKSIQQLAEEILKSKWEEEFKKTRYVKCLSPKALIGTTAYKSVLAAMVEMFEQGAYYRFITDPAPKADAPNDIVEQAKQWVSQNIQNPDYFDILPDVKPEAVNQYCERAFIAGAAAASPKWIKVSERLPVKENTYPVRWWDDSGKPFILGACMWDGYQFDTRDEPDDIEGAQPDEWLEEAPASQAIPDTDDKDLIAIASNLSMHTIRQVAEKEEGELQPCCANSCDGFKCESGSVHLIDPNKEEGNDVPSDNNSNEAAVASHTASSGNSNQ
jgi:hypothetical protein